MAKLKNNFFAAAKDYGVKRIFLSLPFIGSLLLTGGFVCFALSKDKLPEGFVKEMASQVQGVSVGVFSILFAGFAIVISLSDEIFVKFLQRAKIFTRILFPFWFDSCLYLLAVTLSFVCTWLPENCSFEVLTISVWFLLWALLDTFFLVMTTVLFGHYRAEYIEYKAEIEQEFAEELEKKKQREKNPKN